MSAETGSLTWPPLLAGVRFHLVGIKGTGMCAFAELLQAAGAVVGGSDVEDTFYTDAILEGLGIPFARGFGVENLPEDACVVVHSAAWRADTHPELLAARERGLPVWEYTRALGAFSAGRDSSGICGVHGKTTTTALTGTLVKALGLDGSVLAGSGVSNFGNRSTLVQGDRFFVAETCEYRRHFLDFHPRRIILTSVEMDHQDYFRDREDINDAFVTYCCRLPRGGLLIWCADDAGARVVADRVARLRPDIRMVPYGFAAPGPWGIRDLVQGEGFQSFRTGPGVLGERELRIHVPGRHVVLDAAAALCLADSIRRDICGDSGAGEATAAAAMVQGLAEFRGSRRRSEIVGQRDGVLVLDDYAHHPTAIRTTLEGYREFWKGRRLVVDFMSHTWSRTRALLDEFAGSFGAADKVIIHDIYPSARETPDPWMSGERFRDHVAAAHPDVTYFPGVMDALGHLEGLLRPGDILVTMGAGDNWKLGRAWLDSSRKDPK